MLTLTVHVALCQSEINDIDGIFRVLSSSNKEVIRLDITMDDSLFMHFLDVTDKLYGDQKHCLEI